MRIYCYICKYHCNIVVFLNYKLPKRKLFINQNISKVLCLSFRSTVTYGFLARNYKKGLYSDLISNEVWEPSESFKHFRGVIKRKDGKHGTTQTNVFAHFIISHIFNTN